MIADDPLYNRRRRVTVGPLSPQPQTQRARPEHEDNQQTARNPSWSRGMIFNHHDQTRQTIPPDPRGKNPRGPHLRRSDGAAAGRGTRQGDEGRLPVGERGKLPAPPRLLSPVQAAWLRARTLWAMTNTDTSRSSQSAPERGASDGPSCAGAAGSAIQPGSTVAFKGEDVQGTVSRVRNGQAFVNWIGFRYSPAYDGWHHVSKLRLLPNVASEPRAKPVGSDGWLDSEPSTHEQ